ncbi:hypothetical protein ACFOKI_11275 [Sphingomonas qilianensis]|uniref:Anti-sigma factor NepR domain-containing protein n=1 Tax=Sphingomonas qilianensis TaxID=1736690 RepID=A0ABU9XPC7_9SPHN
MSKDFDLPRRQAQSGDIAVAAPRPCDQVSGALHRAYDNGRGMPDDFLRLLAKLNAL